MNKLLPLTSMTLCLVLLSLMAHGQASLNYSTTDRNPGYWTFGLNLGFSYQTSDVQAEPFSGGGLGLTLAKNLYYRPGAPFAFDLRGRYLYAEQYGMDAVRNFEVVNNAALNGSRGPDYRSFPSDLNIIQGFVYNNHETRVHELALEGVLSFNKLRERTGVILGLYGGLGLDWYRVSVDQLNEAGDAYYRDYATLDPNQKASQIRRELRNQILDGIYETPADRSDANGTLGFMPSLGLELGYQFTPRFSMHLGHRVTFAGTDVLDGERFVNADPDRYHYTSLAARWLINTGRSREEPPIIRVTEPSEQPAFTSRTDAVVRATIENISNASQVRCELNGQFADFDFAGTSFRKVVNLRPGRNELLITATNSAGSDSETVVFINATSDTPPPPPPPPAEEGRAPDVLITEPINNPYRTEAATVNVRASIREVSDRQNVQLLLNGSQQRFDFDPRTGQLTGTLTIAEGENKIDVRATNRWGTDQEGITVIRNIPGPQRPEVRITEPANGSRTDRDRSLLRATVSGVSRKEDITLSVNGRNQTDFSYDAARQQMSATVQLSTGSNRLEVRATNRAGTSTDAVTVVFEPYAPPPPPPPPPPASPSVRITRPANNASFTTSEADLEALVQGVRNADQIVFTYNSRRITNFRFDPGRGELTARLTLQAGNNTVRIEASNGSSTAQDGINIRYTPPNRPTVSIEAPSDGAVVGEARVNLRATTSYVNSRSEVEILLNNRRQDGFEFNASRQEITAPLNLSTGENTLLVRVRNAGGTHEDQVRIRYEVVQRPTVDLREPIDGRTYTNAEVDLVAVSTRVDRSQDVSIWLNEQAVTGFSFDVGRQEVRARIRLVNGNNRVRIRVQNAGGSAEDVANVVYRPTEKPEVSILDPVQNPYRSSQPTLTARARTRHVSQKSQLSVTLNGQGISDFQFVPDRNEVSVNVRLREGENTLEIQASTDGGRASDRRTIQYQALQAPAVNITSPARGATLTVNSTQVKALVYRANNPGDKVVFSVNGREVSGFQLSGEQFTGTAADLQAGENRIRVSATNAAGTESDEILVNYQPPAPPKPQPTVAFVKPATPGQTNRISRAAIEAQVKYAERLTITLNGKAVTNFTHNTAEEKVTFSVLLVKGTNTIVVKAENESGTAEASTTILYSPVSANAPTVVIESVSLPVENPMSPGLGPSTVRASIRNISDASQIVFTLNGERITNFTFDSKTGAFVGQCQLRRGGNTVVIQASNGDGSAEDRREISL